MFTLEQMLTPVWNTDVVYGESFTMYRDKNGEVSAPLLYEPEQILEVRDARLQILYEEGKDYLLRDGRLILPEGSSVPFMEYGEVYMKEAVPGGSFPYPCEEEPSGERHLLFREGHFFHDRQIAVTYRCKRGGWGGYIPEYKGHILKNTLRRLTEEKRLKMLLFGDSISAGCNSSAMGGVPPFQPDFGTLFAEGLRHAYGAEVDFINPSVGGRDSVWAMKELDGRVLAEAPDLVILAFGMNGRHPTAVLESHLKDMIGRIRAARADTDIILIATSTPNPLLTGRARFWHEQYLYGEMMKKLEREGVALLDMGALQRELHGRKRFIDTTGNNVNHPNDFFIRIHAQALSALLIK